MDGRKQAGGCRLGEGHRAARGLGFPAEGRLPGATPGPGKDCNPMGALPSVLESTRRTPVSGSCSPCEEQFMTLRAWSWREQRQPPFG